MSRPIDSLLVPDHVAADRLANDQAKARVVVPCLIRRPWPPAKARQVVLVSKRVGKTLAQAGIEPDTYGPHTKPERHAAEYLRRTMHVTTRDERQELPFCRQPIPEGFELWKLTQEDNATVMTLDRTLRWPWKRLVWCQCCADVARWLLHGFIDDRPR